MRTFLSIFLLFISAYLEGQIITTVAGNGVIGYSGDGGPALDASLGDMYYTAPAFDNAGNMYIAQNFNNTIRKIDLSGTITTIAGTNQVIGYTGDGGPAVNALLYHPTSIAIDKSNNIYFTDRNGSIIRKIDPAGIITTVSGQYISSCGSGDGGPLALARFSAISAIYFDQSDNLYISDYGCNTVRKVNSAGIVTTIAGNGTHGFSGDGGPATQAQLAYPCKVAVDNVGNVYIPDAQNHRIRKISTSGIISTFAGTGINGNSGDGGPALGATMEYPGSVVIDQAGNLYFGDYNEVIRKIDGLGIISRYAGSGTPGYSGDGGPAFLADLLLTEGNISIHNNDIYFVNYIVGDVIRKVSDCSFAAINQQPTNVTLCNSGEIVFNINASNATDYQWQINIGTGWTDLTDNGTYSGTATNTLNISGVTTAMNNYQYRCSVSNDCGPIYSKAGELKVNNLVNPSITLTSSSANICEGVSVNFKAETINGGNSPSYQWKKNGMNVGDNQDTYTDKTLVNEDVITCILTSNADCLVNNPVNSNSIVMTVTNNVTPAVSISASVNNICSGTPVSFTSSVTNGSSSHAFSWFKNGEQLPENSATYTDNSLINGDEITCIVTSNGTCVTAAEAKSAPITMRVIPLVVPSVTITSSSNAVCRNIPVVFTASSGNERNAPVYQWLKNGQPVGGNGATYTDNDLVNGDIITCVLTSNADCLSTSGATSNPLTITIYPDPVVVLDKTNTLCEESTRILDAGNFSSYLWNTGSTNRTITINQTGKYSITVTDKNGCTGKDFTEINTILPSPTNFLATDTSICSYGDLLLKPNVGFRTYLWNTGSANSFITITQPGEYWLQVTNTEGCSGSDTIRVLRKQCLEGFYMPTAFTPNSDGLNDFIKPIILGKVIQYQFTIYNRFGQRVFHSTDLSKEWDGKYKQQPQDGNVFLWVCGYQFDGEQPQVRKGSFVMIK